MGHMRRAGMGQVVCLQNENTVGRSSTCQLVLTDPKASGHHAVIRWTGTGWDVRDLGSRNGTFVNAQRVPSGGRQLLSRGAELGFGTPHPQWQVTDVSAPLLSARSPQGAWVTAEDEVLVLPDEASPEVIVFGDDDGRWVVEQGDDTRPLGEGRRVMVGGMPWVVFPPSAAAPTATEVGAPTGLSLGQARLVFEVSRDEEHVELVMQGPSQVARIPHRAQLYLLLTLARARLRDIEQGESAAEQGWCYASELCRGLGIPEDQFNVAIFRARRHLRNAGVVDAKGIVERRRGSHQLRLGTGTVVIQRA